MSELKGGFVPGPPGWCMGKEGGDRLRPPGKWRSRMGGLGSDPHSKKEPRGETSPLPLRIARRAWGRRVLHFPGYFGGAP